ncbi:MAG: UDP-N-acetylmuramoyl-L-alanine--D-glutamate ligase [Gemmatimonadota bacterium]
MTIPPVPVEGARVGVLGLARSGVAAARLLAREGARVYASDVSSNPAAAAAAAELSGEGIEAVAGGHDAERLSRCQWLAVSPGIPPDAPVLADAMASGRPVYAELEVAAWFGRAPIAAVTGTNGKTTTTALLGAIARGAGLNASVAGNIGRPFARAVLEDPAPEWFVLEVSSFQLAGIATFRPRIAVVLNLTSDHLDRYPDMDAYARDKERIAENQAPEDDLCLNAEDPALAGFAARRPPRRRAFHRREEVASGATAKGGMIALAGLPDAGPVLAVERLALPGAHNLQNALAATVAASLMGLDREAIAKGLAAFTGVPHRLETVAEMDGVRFINDSKATNVDSAAVALEAFEAPLIVIMGGRHKGSPYAPLASRLGRTRTVLAIGEAAPLIERELGGIVPVERVGTLDRAVARARAVARPGDVVLLAPACSSYDQFEDFEQRGARFRELVSRSDAVAPARKP